jgi:hypothetical protein
MDISQLLKLKTPQRVQDFLDQIPYNFEEAGETCSSPVATLRRQNAHCLEAAYLGALALSLQGHPPLVMNLKTASGDQDHAVVLFKEKGLWGALSKTNHAVLRYRDPVYRNVRELALSYFHEYYLGTTGRKTLRAYSKPLNLNRFGTAWKTKDTELWNIAYALRDATHFPIAPKEVLAKTRPAGTFERGVMEREEWVKSKSRP